jgi:hypothetical protein
MSTHPREAQLGSIDRHMAAGKSGLGSPQESAARGDYCRRAAANADGQATGGLL